MEELAKRFKDSASVLRSVARRVEEAARASRAMDRDALAAGGLLAEEVGAGPALGFAFSYLEYLEFSGPAEFARFRHGERIADGAIASIDWETLSRQLLDRRETGPDS